MVSALVIDCAALKFPLLPGANLDRTDRNAISPFMHAAKQGHTEAVRFLIDKVPDLDKTDKFGMCALSYAVQGRFLKHANKFGSSGPAKGRHLEIVRLLVEKGVNVNCKDRYIIVTDSF